MDDDVEDNDGVSVGDRVTEEGLSSGIGGVISSSPGPHKLHRPRGEKF